MKPKRQDKKDEEDRGLHCPKCGCAHLPVVYTRHVGMNRTLRRRECRHCGTRVSTYEKMTG